MLLEVEHLGQVNSMEPAMLGLTKHQYTQYTQHLKYSIIIYNYYIGITSNPRFYNTIFERITFEPI